MEEMKAALTDPALYARDPWRFTTLTTELGKATADLATMEDRWLELEILRETLET